MAVWCETIKQKDIRRKLYLLGAAASLAAALLFRRNMDAEWFLLRQAGIVSAGPSLAPSTAAGWFSLLQEQTLVGLTLLNLFDLINYALVGVIFLALVTVMKRTTPILSLIAGLLGAAGIAVHFIWNQSLAILSLSSHYAASSSASERATLLAAGQNALLLHQHACFAGFGICVSFLLVSTSGLILSVAMLRAPEFDRGTAVVGMLANGFGLSYYLMLLINPALVFVPLSISAIFLLAWYLRVGARLWSLSRQRVLKRLPADVLA